MKMIDMDEAYDKARNCEYAQAAVQPEENPINWADAGCFYLEGYNQAVQEINAYFAAGARHVNSKPPYLKEELAMLASAGTPNEPS